MAIPALPRRKIIETSSAQRPGALTGSAAPPVFAQSVGPRYGLVIGNGNYANFGKLANPFNDATDIAAALGDLGFKVNLVEDGSRKQMNQALNDFHDELAADPSSAGFFWYAGHGVQSKGENYLLPALPPPRERVRLRPRRKPSSGRAVDEFLERGEQAYLDAIPSRRA